MGAIETAYPYIKPVFHDDASALLYITLLLDIEVKIGWGGVTSSVHSYGCCGLESHYYWCSVVRSSAFMASHQTLILTLLFTNPCLNSLTHGIAFNLWEVFIFKAMIMNWKTLFFHVSACNFSFSLCASIMIQKKIVPCVCLKFSSLSLSLSL